MVEVVFGKAGEFGPVLSAAYFHHMDRRGRSPISINPRIEARFQPTFVSAEAIMMYDTKSDEYVTVEMMTYGIQRQRVETGDFQTCKAAFERLSPNMYRG